MSLALFVLGLRDLGAARTGAYFSLAPFVGAVLAVIMLGEPLSVQLLVAGCLMGFGLWLHLAEQHEHEHAHEAMEHEHGIGTTRTTSTNTSRPIRPASRIPIGIGMRRWCTGIRTIPTCIIDTGTGTRIDRRFAAYGLSRLQHRKTHTR